MVGEFQLLQRRLLQSSLAPIFLQHHRVVFDHDGFTFGEQEQFHRITQEIAFRH